MPCFHPLEAFMITDLTIDPSQKGRRKILFSEPRVLSKYCVSQPVKLPCGQCVGCRLERSRQWAIRCVHEASLHSTNSFITLTFSPEYLETRSNKWSLDYREFQLFMKRLRRKFGKVRFYHCGEYGEMCRQCNQSLYMCARSSCKKMDKILGRPHYHACLFGFDFPDKELWKITDGGCKLYISKSLEDLWTDPKTGMQMGFCTIGDVTFESAAYVARYIMKKITGDLSDDYYVRFDSGECLKPEYTTMSRKPGIGRAWLDEYINDVYPQDFVIMNGRKLRPPRYYDGVLKVQRPYCFDDIKFKREENAKLHVDNNTPERLKVREAVQLDSFNLLPRNKEF